MNIPHISAKSSRLRLHLGVACVSLASLVSSLLSQEVPPAPVQTNPQNQPLPATQTLSPDSLKQLLAPIALYPDALIALILPASTVPSDIVLASRYVAGNGDPKQIPNQSWDNSVQSLASYPDVVTWMDKNLEWTTSLGQAFLVQPADVMNAIQQLRAQAQAAGNLVNTPQQVIVKEKTFIRIVPAEPEYLYVPQYDPEIVYVQPYSQDYGPLITFGVGFAVGSWLNYDFDWNRHQIYQGDWQPGWDYSSYGNGGNNNRTVNVVNIVQNTAQPWQASSRSRQQLTQQQQSFRGNSNKFGNAQVASGVTPATANNASQHIRQVPKPSRANFGNRGAGSRNATLQPSASTTQPVPGTTTTPPNVAGQQGKPLRNPNNANAGQNVNKHGQPTGQNASQPLPSTVQAPQNPALGQIGNVPVTNPSKKQRGVNPATSGRVPQTTQAPVVDQNGRTQPAAAQPTTGGKHNQHPSSSPQTQTAPPASQVQPSSAPSGNTSGHKNKNSDRPSSPPTQSQPSQPAPGNNHQQQKPQVQSNQSQQPAQAPKKYNNPAPQQQPQQPQQQPKQQQQKPQQQQQQPKQQQQKPQQQQQQQPKQQQQKPQQQQQQQPKQQQQKPQQQQQKPAPAAKQNPAPAAANPAQSAPAGKKSDKKKDADKQP